MKKVILTLSLFVFYINIQGQAFGPYKKVIDKGIDDPGKTMVLSG